MDFNSSLNGMKSVLFRYKPKLLDHLVGGKCADARAIVTDIKDCMLMRMKDTIASS